MACGSPDDPVFVKRILHRSLDKGLVDMLTAILAGIKEKPLDPLAVALLGPAAVMARGQGLTQSVEDVGLAGQCERPDHGRGYTRLRPRYRFRASRKGAVPRSASAPRRNIAALPNPRFPANLLAGR